MNAYLNAVKDSDPDLGRTIPKLTKVGTKYLCCYQQQMKTTEFKRACGACLWLLQAVVTLSLPWVKPRSKFIQGLFTSEQSRRRWGLP